MLCHSVRSCQLPSLSLKRSLVARLNLATGVPCGVNFTSGSLPRLPMRITLLTLFPTMGCSIAGVHYSRIACVGMVLTVTDLWREYHFGQAGVTAWGVGWFEEGSCLSPVSFVPARFQDVRRSSWLLLACSCFRDAGWSRSMPCM